MSHCTINPVVGMAHRLSMLQAPPGTRKRVAVIGGGPAGMQCAVLLKKRGHSPVIFEQGPELGGQILTAKYSVRKWELERYRQYLIRQVEEHAIEVHLDTAATPELIRPMGFDAVIAALGAEPRLPPLEITGRQVWNVVNVYPNVEKLGKRVVVVGGASAAAEAANFLAETGREVVELSRKNIVGYDLNPIRMRGYMNHLAEQLGVTVIPNAAVTEIGTDFVCFRDAEGKECQIECDDVVLSGGMTPRAEAAMSFWDCAAEFYVIGDARHATNLRAAITDAYCVAWKI